MISIGDRIVMRRADVGINVSGIVAMAISLDWGDWAVATWNGSNEGGNEYQIGCISEFAVDVLEKDRKFPPIPKWVRKMFARTANETKAECNDYFIKKTAPMLEINRRVMLANGMDIAARDTAQRFLKDHSVDDVLASRISILSVLIDVLKKSEPPMDSMKINFAQTSLVVFMEFFEKALREVKP